MKPRCRSLSSFLALALVLAGSISFLAVGQTPYTAVCIDPSGSYCYASGINNSGQVVGTFSASDGQDHAFLYSNGKIADLGTLGGLFSAAFSINDIGQIVGDSATAENDSGGYAITQGFLYSGGKMTDLGTLGGSDSAAFGINNSGRITGDSHTSGDVTIHAFLYGGGTMTDLGTLGGSASVGKGINNKGQITGYS